MDRFEWSTSTVRDLRAIGLELRISSYAADFRYISYFSMPMLHGSSMGFPTNKYGGLEHTIITYDKWAGLKAGQLLDQEQKQIN